MFTRYEFTKIVNGQVQVLDVDTAYSNLMYGAATTTYVNGVAYYELDDEQQDELMTCLARREARLNAEYAGR